MSFHDETTRFRCHAWKTPSQPRPRSRGMGPVRRWRVSIIGRLLEVALKETPVGVEPTWTGLQPVAVPSGSSVKESPATEDGRRWLFVSKSSDPAGRHQKRPDLRQHFLNRLPLPQGQRSLRPSFSSSSLSPWTIRTPRFTLVSDGNPLRRLLIVSKKMVGRRGCDCTWRTSFQD